MMSGSEFAKKLFEMSGDGISHSEMKRRNKELMAAFLAFGSETPDNVNCAKRVEYGIVDDPDRQPSTRVRGLKVKGRNILLADIMNIVESLDLPEEVREYDPDLTAKDWKAITRMVTMILVALERPEST